MTEHSFEDFTAVIQSLIKVTDKITLIERERRQRQQIENMSYLITVFRRNRLSCSSSGDWNRNVSG